MDHPSLIPLADPAALDAGGKARGLHLLIRAGAEVPDGFVIAGADAPGLAEEVRCLLERCFDLENDTFAVRSSGLDEDGSQASFAGQYETILGVKGLDAILSAVRACRGSASSRRVREYAAHRARDTRAMIPVIVQRMVEARCAGVLFTADPVSNRRDRILVNVVAGLGERLVGGASSGEQYVLSRRGRELAFASEYDRRLLSDGELDALRREGLRIEEACRFPADLEWAIDVRGELRWLQLRPITTLSPVHPNELDCAPPQPETHLLTRCNVGEMMPGPVTPLTWSVFGRGIDVGMQDFLVRLRVQDRIREENRFIFMFCNHLFIDMKPLYDIPRKVAFTTKTDVENSICGRAIESPATAPTRSTLVRLRNFCCYVGYFMSAGRRLRALRRLAAGLRIARDGEAAALYRRIDEALPHVFEAWAHHYATSAKSGTLNTALLRILESDGSGTTQDNLGTLSSLLTDLGGINGAVALEELEGIRQAIQADPSLREAFRRGTSAEGLALLRSASSGGAGRRFRRFLREHGHRCVREAELREKSWENDPEALIRLLQRATSAGNVGVGARDGRGGEASSLLARYSARTRLIVACVAPSARRYVVARENSKSLCIRVQYEFRKAYLRLGELMTAEGKLDDTDEVFFLTHQELGALIAGTGRHGRETANARRDMFPSLFGLDFDDFTWGIPEATERQKSAPPRDGLLRGVPVSAGIVTGRARIINTLSDAETLVPGDIMIASYTDVGWTPYFSTIAGLVTEIGSTLSHGAVVAREYGIPAIVAVPDARHHIRTGDTLTIDGQRGIVEVHRAMRAAG